MSVARHGGGVGAAVRALASQIHPVFMLPPVAASAFGAVLVGDVAYAPVVVHLGVVFCGLYTAHVKDGYVDFHRRAEDDDHPLTERGCRLALALSTLGFAAGTAVLGVLVGPFAALLCLPGWLIGYLHAPQLDTHPVGATIGYPTGIALALLGGYYVQARTFSATVLAFAALFLVILAGIKIIDDATDHDYDRTIGKRTVAVVLGPPRARRTAYGLMALGLAGVVAFSATGIFPPSSVGSVAAFAVVAAVARRAGENDRLATMLLVRASYLFLAVLVVAVWLQPLS